MTTSGVKIKVKCEPDDTIGDLKKLVAAQTGTRADKLKIQKWHTVYKDHITLGYVSLGDVRASLLPATNFLSSNSSISFRSDYEISDGMGLELFYM